MLSFVRSMYLSLVDIFVAAGMLTVVAYAAIDTDTLTSGTEPEWVSLLAATLIAGPIVIRRWLPLPALATSLTASFASALTGVIPAVAAGAPVASVAIVLYLVASDTPRRQSVPALVACIALSVAFLLGPQAAGTESASWGDRLFVVCFASLVLVTGWTLGFATRERRRHAVESAARQAEQAVAEERLRIARELHDIVAHTMSVIAVKAGIGNHVADERPDEAREALRVIEATSRGSLAEMRHLLGVLRSEVDSVEHLPAPGPADIPALVERARLAGASVSLSLDDTDGLPEGVGLSVYRIVQEALTNVVRHASAARCATTASVSMSAEAVRIEVVNDGPRVEEGPGGHGLIGMRERVAVYGGRFAAGPRAEGGWRVSAVLPR